MLWFGLASSDLVARSPVSIEGVFLPVSALSRSSAFVADAPEECI